MTENAPSNILLIMTDQHLARALGCMGHDVVKTPNIDRLAARGMLFERAYCASPVCGPSRAAVFSGLYPSATGATANPGVFHHGTESYELPRLLRDGGYYTALVGKLHLGPIEDDHGFVEKHLHDAGYSTYHENEPPNSEYVQWLADQKFNGDINEVIKHFNADEEAYGPDNYRFIMGSNWRTEEEHSNTWITEQTVDFLKRAANRDDSAFRIPHSALAAPFFLFTSYFGPHQPMLAPEPWGSMYDPNEIELPPEFYTATEDKPIAREKLAASPLMQDQLSEQQYREALAAYYGQISMIDHGIGQILDALETQGLADNTIVVLTADHGDHAGQFGLFFKSTMYENAARVPLIVADPTQTDTAGKPCRQVVNNMDLYATLLESAGLPSPATHSRSLTGLLNDPDDGDWSNATVSELGPWSMLAEDHFKLVRFQPEGGPALYELYDLDEDVPDGTNLCDVNAYGERVAAMKSRLEDPGWI